MPPEVHEIDAEAAREALEHWDGWLAYRVGYQRIPGVQAAVHLHDAVVLSTAHGLADVERGVQLTTGHLFRIASHSKTFTATAVMQLVEAGRLRLDDPASAHVDDLVGTALAAVTVGELLSHASGIYRDSADGDFWQLLAPFPGAERLRAVLRAPAAAVLPRNERFKYSNIAYGLLGLVIEAVTGVPYAEHVQAAVVDRLGLRDTGPELDPARADDYATGYSALAYASERVPIDHVDTRALAAATGFYATASDLVTYFSAHYLGDDRLLGDDAKRLMQQPRLDTGSAGGRYALGLSVTTLGDRELIGHGGGYPGHITSSVADARARLAVSVLTNAIDGTAELLAHAAVKLIDLACARPRPAPSPDVDPSRFTGRFASLWGVVDVALLGGRLFLLHPTAADPTADASELEVVDASTLRAVGGPGYGSYGEPLVYRFAADGSVESVRGGSGATLLPLDRFTLPARVAAPGTGAPTDGQED